MNDKELARLGASRPKHGTGGTLTAKSNSINKRTDLYILSQSRLNNQYISKVEDEEEQKEVQEDDRTWFSKSKAFEDGWDFGDGIKTALGTVGDLGINILAGITSLGEGIADTIYYTIGDVADLLGNEEYAELSRERAQLKVFDTLLEAPTSYLDDYSVFGEKIDDISKGVGQVAGVVAAAYLTKGASLKMGLSPTTAATASNIVSHTAIGSSAYGNARTEAYEAGATDTQSAIYGTINAAGEIISEMMFAGLSKGTSKTLKVFGIDKSLLPIDDALVKSVQDKLKSDVTKNLAEIAIRSGFEGVEEVSSGLISAIGKKLTYMSKEDLVQLIKDEKLWEQFYMGALTSAVTQAPTTISSINRAKHNLNAVNQLIEGGHTEDQIRQELADSGFKQEDIDHLLEAVKNRPTSTLKLQYNEDLFKLSDNDIRKITDLTEIDAKISKAKEVLTTPTHSDIVKSKIDKIIPVLDKLEAQRAEIVKKTSKNKKLKTVKKIDEALKKTKVDVTDPVHVDKMIEASELADDVDSDLEIPVTNNTRQVNNKEATKYTEAETLLATLSEANPDVNVGEIVVNPTKEQQRIIEIGAAFGKQVVFLKGSDLSGMTTPGNSDMIFINDKVESGLLVKTSNKNATLYALGHELWHSIRNKNPEVYAQFVDFVKETITDEQLIKFAERYNPTQAERILSDIQIDGEFNLDELRTNPDKYIEQTNALNMIIEEIVANEFGGMITDVEYMGTLQQANPSLFTKIVNILRNFFKALTKPVYKSSLTQYQITNIRNQFEAVVKTLDEQAQVTEETGKLKMNVAKNDVQNTAKPDSINQQVNTGEQKATKSEQKVAKTDVEKPQKVDKKEKSAEKPKKSAEIKDPYTEFLEAYSKANSPEGTLQDLQRAEEIYYKNKFNKDFKYEGLEEAFDNIRKTFDKPKKEVSKDLKKEVKKEVKKETKLPTKKVKTLTDEEIQAEKEYKARLAKSEKLAEQDRKKREAYLEKQREILDSVSKVKIETPEPAVDTSVKVRQMSMEERFDMVNKSYERYLNAQPSKRDGYKKSAYNEYKFYKNAGGTEIIPEFETMRNAEIDALPGKKTRKTYENTIQESPYFKNLVKDIHVFDVDKVIREYKPTTHKELLENAKQRIIKEGYTAIEEFITKPYLNAEDVAMATILAAYARDTNDVAAQTIIATKLTYLTDIAQTLEASKMLKLIDPKVYTESLQRQIDRMKKDLLESRDPAIRAWVSEQTNIDGLDLTDADRRWIEEMKLKADKMDPNSDEYRLQYALIYKYIADRIPKTLGTKILTWRRFAMLGNLKTGGRNVLGNVPMVPINAIVDFVGSKADKFLAKKFDTGIRTLGSAGLLTGRGFKYAVKGANQSIQEYRLGVNTNSMGFDYTQQRGDVFNNKTHFGRTMNKLVDVVDFGMDFGDRPFEEYYKGIDLENLMKLNGVDTPTQAMIDMATASAEKRTWKNNGKAVQMVSGIRNALNKVNVYGVGLGDIIMPFVTTPANLAVAVYEYSPLVGIEIIKSYHALTTAIANNKGVMEAQRAFAENIGKLSASMILYTLAYALAKAGITSGDEDEDADVRELMKAQGFQPFSIQIGDKSYTYDWSQPLSTPFAVMSELQRTTKLTGEKQGLFEAVVKGLSIGGSRLYEQSFLYTVKNLFNADDPINGILDVMSTVPASFIPTLSKQLADTIDPNVKVTFDKNSKLATMWNKTAVKIPGLKSTLPTKKNVLGQDTKLYGGSNNLFNVMINPSNVSTNVSGEYGMEIMDVYAATGDKTIMPQVAVKYYDADINGDGVKERVTFSTREQGVLQAMMGETYLKVLEDMMTSDVYNDATYEQKATALKSLAAYSKTKALLESGRLGTYSPKSGDAYQIMKYIDLGMTESNAVMYDAIINEIDSLYDDMGETIAGSQKGQQAYAVIQLPISTDQKNLMLQQVSATSKYPETVDSLSNLQTKEEFIDYYSLTRHDYFSSENYSRDDYDIATQYYNFKSADFIKYVNNLSNIKSDYNANGEVITNSKKKKIIAYINGLPLTQIQKIYLYGTAGYSVKQWRGNLYNYINNLKISASEKQKIWENLGLK